MSRKQVVVWAKKLKNKLDELKKMDKSAILDEVGDVVEEVLLKMKPLIDERMIGMING